MNKSNKAVNYEADALASALSAGTLEVRTGTIPATADDTATGTLLGAIPLNSPAIVGNAVNGVITLDVPVQVLAVAGGEATWGRFKDNAAATIMDVSIGVSATDLTIDNATVVTNDPLKITSFTYTVPK